MESMRMSNNQRPLSEDGEHCGGCRHSVDVRGMENIVCLAYLSIRPPLTDGSCVEFERKGRRPAALARG